MDRGSGPVKDQTKGRPPGPGPPGPARVLPTDGILDLHRHLSSRIMPRLERDSFGGPEMSSNAERDSSGTREYSEVGENMRDAPNPARA